jgi:RNA polymerase sigma-70 factor, ECF subfamily
MLQRHIAPVLQSAQAPGRRERAGDDRGDGALGAPAVHPPARAALDADADSRLVALYRDHLAGVYRYVFSRVGNRQDAEDITAQVFMAAVDAIASASPPREPGAWLLTIARRRLADHFRRRRPTATLDDVGEVLDAGADPMRGIMAGEEMARLDAILADLPETDLELLRMRFAAGLTYGEVARVLGRTEGAIKMAVHRLLRRMALNWEVSDARTV